MFSFQYNVLQGSTFPFLVPTPPPLSDILHTPTPALAHQTHSLHWEQLACGLLEGSCPSWPGTGTRHSRPRGPPLGQKQRGQSSEWGRELRGREREGLHHPPSGNGQTTRWRAWGAPPSGPSNTGRDAVRRGLFGAVSQDNPGNCLLVPRERRAPGARQAPASGRWEKPPRGQGSFSGPALSVTCLLRK